MTAVNKGISDAVTFNPITVTLGLPTKDRQ
jgi:hypothetical protein